MVHAVTIYSYIFELQTRVPPYPSIVSRCHIRFCFVLGDTISFFESARAVSPFCPPCLKAAHSARGVVAQLSCQKNSLVSSASFGLYLACGFETRWFVLNQFVTFSAFQ